MWASPLFRSSVDDSVHEKEVGELYYFIIIIECILYERRRVWDTFKD